MTPAKTAPGAAFVILGTTGDLNHRLLLSSINMTASDLLGDDSTILGIGRADGDDEWSGEGVHRSKQEPGKGAGGHGDDARAARALLRQRLAYLQRDAGGEPLPHGHAAAYALMVRDGRHWPGLSP